MGKIMLKAYKYRLYLKESNNRHKARLKVAKLHEKITNQRKNFLQQLSTKLIRENQSDRKSTRLNSSHLVLSRMPSSA